VQDDLPDSAEEEEAEYDVADLLRELHASQPQEEEFVQSSTGRKRPAKPYSRNAAYENAVEAATDGAGVVKHRPAKRPAVARPPPVPTSPSSPALTSLMPIGGKAEWSDKEKDALRKVYTIVGSALLPLVKHVCEQRGSCPYAAILYPRLPNTCCCYRTAEGVAKPPPPTPCSCPPPPYKLWKTYKHLYKQLKRMEAAERDLKRRNEEARRELAKSDDARRAFLMATSGTPSMAAPAGMVATKCV